MKAEARKVQVKYRVRPDLAEGWKTLAERRGLTATAFQELVMQRVLQGDDAPVGLTQRTELARKRTVSVRLFDPEIQAIKDAASADGYTLAGWVAALLRAKLRQAPVHTGKEIDALLRYSTQLMAIGRNINAAVRRLHSEGLWSERNQPMMATLAVIKQAEAEIHAIQNAARRRGAFE